MSVTSLPGHRRALEQLDPIARRELDDRLLPRPRAAGMKPAPLRLRADLRGPHCGHPHVEDLLDGPRDLRLVRAVVDPERVLAVGHERVALLGDDRLDDHLAGVHHFASLARSETCSSAVTESTRDWWPIRSATPTSPACITSTAGRLRKLLGAATSPASSTPSVGVRAPHFSSH